MFCLEKPIVLFLMVQYDDDMLVVGYFSFLIDSHLWYCQTPIHFSNGFSLLISSILHTFLFGYVLLFFHDKRLKSNI